MSDLPTRSPTTVSYTHLDVYKRQRLFGQMTVEENVLVAFNESFSYRMGGAIFRTPKFWKQEREMHTKAIDLLKIFGLEGLAETEAANLPYGARCV